MEINRTKQKQFGQAIVHSIEMASGENSTVTTIYKSNEVGFEELVSYMQLALFRCLNVKSVKTDVGSFRSGKFESTFSYERIEFERDPRTFPHPHILPEFFCKSF